MKNRDTDKKQNKIIVAIFLKLKSRMDKTNNKTTAAAKITATVVSKFEGIKIAKTREVIKAMEHFIRGLVIVSSHL